MLTLKQINSGYGKKQVLFGITLTVNPGEIVALIGPNGAGKSTILKVIHGLLPIWQGEAIFNEKPLNNTTPAYRVSQGIAFSPQGNRVFKELTVIDNLEIGGCQLTKHEIKIRIEEVFHFFPRLAERRKQTAEQLSGGEQQMLSIGCALIPKPKLLMLDEPFHGLSPNILHDVFEKIIEINNTFSTAILIVEQKVQEILKICKRAYSLKLGKIVFEGTPNELSAKPELLKGLFF